MRANLFIIKVAFIIFIILVTFSSCTKDDQVHDYSYFVSKELAVSYNENYINSMIDVVSASVPEVIGLKSFIMSGVDIYRVVYNTRVDEKDLKVSGLLCVPQTPGDYPVLSFQNGTNTVNAYSPSEFPINYSYQLVEIIASMGYIVVIADYPGFGESSDIAHPYLVKEATVRSLVDMLYTAKEAIPNEFSGINLKNEYYLMGYSQGGWATLALHKALELYYSEDFNIAGSACGAGPYDITLLLSEMVSETTYPMPVYLGYILNAYKAYSQFTNPVTDIFNEPYASRINTLYTGLLSSGEINDQLTTSVSDLINPDFLSGFASSAKYVSVREAFSRNSIEAWHTFKPLLLLHGELDTHVNPVTTETMYSAMIQAGSSPDLIGKVIIPGVDHGEGIAPAMIQSILFLMRFRE